MTDFKVGDRVTINSPFEAVHGVEGKILHHGAGRQAGKFYVSSRNFGEWFNAWELQPIEDEPVFGGTLATAHGGPDFAGICAELCTVLKERHEKYGPLNIANAYGGPMNGLLVRLGDKMARLQHGLDEHGDESVSDTLIDIAGYAVIALLVQRKQWPGVK